MKFSFINDIILTHPDVVYKLKSMHKKYLFNILCIVSILSKKLVIIQSSMHKENDKILYMEIANQNFHH